MQDMHHFLTPTLEKEPDHIILHVGTNDTINSTPQKIVDGRLGLEIFMKEKLERSVKSQFPFQ